MEAAGVIESVGPGVANVKPGDRVGYACAPPGAYTSVRTMRSELLIQLPTISHRRGGRLATVEGHNRQFSLARRPCGEAGRRRLGSCGCGRRRATSMPLGEGARRDVIGATSTEAKVEAGDARRMRSRDRRRRARDFADAVMRLTEGRGVQVVYDAVGKDTFEGSIRALAAARPSRQLWPGVGGRGRLFHRQARQPFRYFVAAQLWTLHGHGGEAEDCKPIACSPHCGREYWFPKRRDAMRSSTPAAHTPTSKVAKRRARWS